MCVLGGIGDPLHRFDRCSNMNTHTHIVIRQPALVADCASAKLKGVININLKILKSTFGKVGAAGSGTS